MSISFTQYVDVTSGAIGENEVASRDLITRVFSTNPLIPTNSFAEFTSAADVASYFGTSSNEYAIAAFVFSFLSKSVTSPQKLSFASYTPAGRVPQAYSDPDMLPSLAQLENVTAGKLEMLLGVTTFTVTGLNFSGAASYAAVATILQTAIQAAVTSDPNWSSATVAYNANVPIGACFEITGGGGDGGLGQIAFMAVSGVDVANLLGFESPNAILSQGSNAQSVVACLTASVAASTNFASFAFIGSQNLTQTQLGQIATWLGTQNISYEFLCGVLPANAAATSALLIGQSGVVLTLSPIATEFPELMPGMILAATDYSKANASQNYMFQQVANVTPSVTDDADKETYDNLRINYFGQTQINGQQISFYQKGVVCGAANFPSDINVFSNEIWLKSDVQVSLMDLLLTINEVPASQAGAGMIISVVQSSITKALLNGTISVPFNPLTPVQQQAITQITGDNTAWRQVQSIGYWLNVSFSTTQNAQAGTTDYVANYTLVYTKNNAVRMIVGTHALV